MQVDSASIDFHLAWNKGAATWDGKCWKHSILRGQWWGASIACQRVERPIEHWNDFVAKSQTSSVRRCSWGDYAELMCSRESGEITRWISFWLSRITKTTPQFQCVFYRILSIISSMRFVEVPFQSPPLVQATFVQPNTLVIIRHLLCRSMKIATPVWFVKFTWSRVFPCWNHLNSKMWRVLSHASFWFIVWPPQTIYTTWKPSVPPLSLVVFISCATSTSSTWTLLTRRNVHCTNRLTDVLNAWQKSWVYWLESATVSKYIRNRHRINQFLQAQEQIRFTYIRIHIFRKWFCLL